MFYSKLRKHFATKRSTTVGLAEGELSVKYHETVVFRYYVDTGDVEVDNGGWATPTTKERINDCLDLCDIPASIYQETRRKRKSDPPGTTREDRKQWYIYFRPNQRKYAVDDRLHFKRAHCHTGGFIDGARKVAS